MDATTGKRRSLVLMALAAAALASAVLVAERFHFRLDLTSERSFTLSRAARGLQAEIPERVRITYYISRALADRHPGPRAVEDFLGELEAASRGKISLSVEDPGAGAGKGAGAAEALGIQPQQLQVVERDEQRVILVYSGVAVQYLDRTKVIPFVLGTDTLEYDVVKAVRAAVGDSGQIATVLVGDADKSLASDYRAVTQALQRSGWEARELPRGQAIPPETTVLLVLGNSAMDDYDTFRVDDWLARGGRAFLAVKGVEIQAAAGLSASPLRQDALLRALESYGIKVRRELVLDRSSLTVPFRDASPYGGATIQYIRYPFWIATRPEYRDTKSPLTSRLPGLDLFWPSPLELLPRDGVAGQALVKTSVKAWLQTKAFAVGPQDQGAYEAEADRTGGQYLLAATLSGALPPVWAGRAVPGREGAERLQPVASPSRPSRLVVVGSADFATDLMGMTQSAFNASFVADAVDWLASGDELLDIKTRGTRDQRLSRLQEPESRSTAILFVYALNLVLVPGAVIAVGLVRASRRRRLSATGEAPPAAKSGVDEGGKTA